jgi:hypothetical protein
VRQTPLHCLLDPEFAKLEIIILRSNDMKVRQVVFHSPGPNWKPEGNFQEQSEELVMEHMNHYRIFYEQGKLALGSPYTDIDSGGMMIADESVTREGTPDPKGMLLSREST